MPIAYDAWFFDTSRFRPGQVIYFDRDNHRVARQTFIVTEYAQQQQYNQYINSSIDNYPYYAIYLNQELNIYAELKNIGTEDMTETIEIELPVSVNKNIIANLESFSKSKEKEIGYYETKRKEATKDKYPDEEQLKGVLRLWEIRLENVLVTTRLCERLIDKLTHAKRPLKLQKNERKVLANVVDNLNLDFSVICPYSSIDNISHPDRFFGFPNLEKKVKARVAEVTEAIKNLTRSDVNIYVK